jgi:DNA invertase Pin-like site-specific DNA recombinase
MKTTLAPLNYGRRLYRKDNTGYKSATEPQREQNCAIYKRLSTHEQIHNSRFSMERQDLLQQRAIKDGFKAVLSDDEINNITSSPEYSGCYWNGNILVIEMDLGRTGTKGDTDRPGLALLIEMIKRDAIDVIYVVDITRLFRDTQLINAPKFAALCAEHHVIIESEG